MVGTLLEARASVKSLRPQDGNSPSGDGGRNPEADFRGLNAPQGHPPATTDPDARLAKKARGRKRSYALAPTF